MLVCPSYSLCHVRRSFSAVSLWILGLVTVCAALVAEHAPSATPAVPGATWLLAHVLFCLPLSRQFELQSQTSLKQSGGITSSCKCLCVPRRLQKGRLTQDLGIAVPSAPSLMLPLGKGLPRSSTEPWLGWQGPHLEPLSTGTLCPGAPSPGTGPVFQSPPGAVGEWQRDGFQH